MGVARNRFKRGDIVKQRRHGEVFDFFHVEDTHTHANGSQGLDAICDHTGCMVGLDGDISEKTTIKNLVEDRLRRSELLGHKI